MRKRRLLALGLVLLLAVSSATVLVRLNRAQAQSYSSSGAFSVAPPPAGCTMTGISDLTNICNDIYLLMGVIK